MSNSDIHEDRLEPNDGANEKNRNFPFAPALKLQVKKLQSSEHGIVEPVIGASAAASKSYSGRLNVIKDLRRTNQIVRVRRK